MDTRRRSLPWSSPALWWRAAIVLVCGAGLLTSAHRVVFFTTQSNIIVFAYLVAAIVTMVERRTSVPPAPRLRGGMVTWITVTFLVSHIILMGGANPLPGLVVADPARALENQSLFLLHYVVPVMVLIDWLVFGPHGLVRWRDGLLWVLYPIGYGLVMIVRGVLFPTVPDRYPYPFLDPTVAGWGGMLWGLLQVVLAVAVIAALIIGLDRLSARVSRAIRPPQQAR